jgi:HEPN/Toprim N-terminal domain 1
VVPYRYVGEDGEPIVEMKEGYAKPLGEVLGRLELLGYTVGRVWKDFDELLRLHNIAEEVPNLTFEAFSEALGTIDVNSVLPDYLQEEDAYLGNFFAREIFDRLCLSRVVDRRTVHHCYSRLGETLVNFHPWAKLRLLALNPANLGASVIWRFADVVDSGYVERCEVVRELQTDNRFLIVTEGSSDAKILAKAKALALLRPNQSDFFYFVDMEEGLPIHGTGNLHRFCQGLVKIGVLNRVLVIYDNDAEGAAKHAETTSLSLPLTMRAMRLPDLSKFRQFDTIGPNGVGVDDINGRAAAIECYLDLRWNAPTPPQVRWTSYNKKLDCYQGELMQKESFTKLFLDLRRKEESYNFEDLDAILNSLITECKAMASTAGRRL